MKRSLRRFTAAAATGAAILLFGAGMGAASAADTPADEASGKRVNINQASASQLALLPRVGAKAADRIVEYRKAHGAFTRAEELMEVKGVGEKLFTELKPYVSTTGPTTLAAKVRSGARGARASRTSGGAGKKNASSSVPVGKGR